MRCFIGDIELQTLSSSPPDRPGFKSNPKDSSRNPPGRMRMSGGAGGEYKYSGISPAVEYGDSGEEDLEEEYKREKKDQTLSSGRLIFHPTLFFYDSLSPTLLHPVFFCSVLSYLVVSCPTLSCPTLSCPVLSCPVLSCPVLHYLVVSCPVLSCPILAYILEYRPCRALSIHPLLSLILPYFVYFYLTHSTPCS